MPARSPARAIIGPAVRRRPAPISRATMCASVVLPRPGGPVSRTWSSGSPRSRGPPREDREVLADLRLADVLAEVLGPQLRLDGDVVFESGAGQDLAGVGQGRRRSLRPVIPRAASTAIPNSSSEGSLATVRRVEDGILRRSAARRNHPDVRRRSASLRNVAEVGGAARPRGRVDRALGLVPAVAEVDERRHDVIGRDGRGRLRRRLARQARDLLGELEHHALGRLLADARERRRGDGRPAPRSASTSSAGGIPERTVRATRGPIPVTPRSSRKSVRSRSVKKP